VRRASESTNTSWRIPEIDGLRALAMLMVYAFHTGQTSSPAVIFGKPWDLFAAVSQFATGVQLFMVLSGFCLFWPLCKSADALAHWDWKEYGWRRLRRIVPPYYAAIIYAAVLPMVLVLIFRMLGMRANWQPMPTAWQLIAHLLFIHTLFPGTWAGITGAFWSLGLEAQFYVVFPLVIFAFRKWRFRVIAAMIVSSVLFRAIIGLVIPTQMKVWEIVLSISFLAHWMQFATGMLVAWLVAKDWREGRERGVWTGAAGLAGALGLYIAATQSIFPASLSYLPIVEVLLTASFGLLIYALCTTRTPVRRFFGSRVMTRLGLMSYSIFLIHQPTAWYFSEMLRKKFQITGLPEFVLLCTAGFAVLLAISYGFFRLFELPYLVAGHREMAFAEPALSRTEAAAWQIAAASVETADSRSVD